MINSSEKTVDIVFSQQSQNNSNKNNNICNIKMDLITTTNVVPLEQKINTTKLTQNIINNNNNNTRIYMNDMIYKWEPSAKHQQIIYTPDDIVKTYNSTTSTSKTKDTTTTTTTIMTQEMKPNNVKVHNLQMHNVPQTNQWSSYNNFYKLNETTKINSTTTSTGVVGENGALEIVAKTQTSLNSNNINKNNNNIKNSINNNNNNNKSHNQKTKRAFIDHYEINDKNASGAAIVASASTGACAGAANNNNNNISKSSEHQLLQKLPEQLEVKQEPQIVEINEFVISDRRLSPIQRTEDQENAFRRIEDVHNYAKLNRYRYSNGDSSNSSVRDDIYEDDDEEDADDDEPDIDENEVVIEIESRERDTVDDNVEIDVTKRRVRHVNADQYENYCKSHQRHLQSSVNLMKVSMLPICNAANVQGKRKYNVKMHEEQLQLEHMNDDDQSQHIDVVTVKTKAVKTLMNGQLRQQRDDEAEDEEEGSTSVTTNVAAAMDVSNAAMRPDHHARRPMNAFLIFCKRHRAIVKDRYKTLENRAITKILGDWWASLEENEKLCFTNLAQQNKDAFFSANPNFKWYKLPAPPLRTLATRPTNAVERGLLDYESEEFGFAEATPTASSMSVPSMQVVSFTANNSNRTKNHSNFFKLADETQMGELSALMSSSNDSINELQQHQQQEYLDNNKKDKHTKANQHNDALHQVLGETTQFLSVHMPIEGNNNNNNNSNRNRSGDAGDCKRRLYSANSCISSNSNSSEDDVTPKKLYKSSRSCKGKIYQELVSSGQIAAIAKKVKTATQASKIQDIFQQQQQQQAHHQEQLESSKLYLNDSGTVSGECANSMRLADSGRTISESEHYDMTNFDLEERIKELPALNLDLYLQRKRNTKKKKKFSAKKRNSNSASSTTATSSNKLSSSTKKSVSSKSTIDCPTTAAVTTTSTRTMLPQQQLQLLTQAHGQAVGSQKRKARKESITRRDVSAIDNEVASLLPMTKNFTTINGCYYFNETTPDATASKISSPTTKKSINNNTTALNTTQNTTLIAAAANEQVPIGDRNDNNNSTTSTIDLLILAEVAANRTELRN